MTDGETGERDQWIGWQVGKLTSIDGIELVGTKSTSARDNEEYSAFPALAVDRSIGELPARSLGYADAAESSYPVYKRLRDEGDLSLCVELANAAGTRADFVHMPADRETGRDPAYYEPLRDLTLRRLALGVVDYEGDEQRTRELIAAAAAGSGGMEFAVATECGMARIDERGPGKPSLERLLELHAQCASPIR